MIRWIDSSIPSFKRLEFHEGLNVLLADAVEDGGDGQTRNSAGKSSFVLIVDFLLGANCNDKSLFRSDALKDARFSGGFRLGGHGIEVERSGSNHNRIYILSSDDDLGDAVEVEEDTGRLFVTLATWKRFLGTRAFGLPSNPQGTDFAKKSAPTTRSMLKYFMRLESDGGFLHPERASKDQQRASWQSSLSYMFGLEWRISQRFQVVRDREKTLEILRREASGEDLGEMVGTVAKLRPQLAIAKKKADEKRHEIANFHVLDSYKDLSDQAAELQREMQTATRRLVTLKESLAHLKGVLDDEAPHYDVGFADMYRESQVQLPDLALKRLSEVEAFHRSVVMNRKLHLEAELSATEREIVSANNTLERAGATRNELLSVLDGKGAFEDLVLMQRELAILEAERATLEERFRAAEALEGRKAELKVDRLELQRALQADHSTHLEALSAIELRISDLIEELYSDRSGRFAISATENGPEFDISIEGDRGGGIRSMEIFCIDIAISESVRRLYHGLGFLIHDSHLFDGVDPRQIRKALLLGAGSVNGAAQYIVTLNSDIVDSLSPSQEEWLAKAILPVRLSDADESGGLFGFRFD